jgi:SAM-dependent methyltransferase
MLHSLRCAWSRLVGARIRILITRGDRRFTIPAGSFHDFQFENADELTLLPRWLALPLASSPDGSRHVFLGEGNVMQIPSRMDYFEYLGYRIPAHLILLTGAGPESLEAIGKAHIAHYQKHVGLAPDMTILEIGCGIGRDALQLKDLLQPPGRYVGIDVTRDSILWCQRNISARHPDFSFHHFDARHELYNPFGTKTTPDFVLPVADASVDRVMLGSVFTHLFEYELLHYMKEIRRVLKPSGLAYATFFLYSDETIKAARRTDRTPFKLRFEHLYGDGCYINDPAFATGAVAYTDATMRRIIEAAGLRLDRPYLKGWWSGAHENADDGQEVAILARP